MKLVNSLSAEIRKTRNTSVTCIAIGAGIFIPVFTALLYTASARQGMRERLMEVPWQTTALGEISTMVALILPASVILITAMVHYVEIRNNTWKQVLTTPRTIIDIHMTKFMIVQYNVLICFFLIYLLAGAFIVLNNIFEIHIINVYQKPKHDVFFKLIGWLYLSTLPIALIQYILSSLFHNVLFPISIGLFLCVCSVMTGNNSNAIWFPYMYPREVFLNTFDVTRREKGVEVKPDLLYQPQINPVFEPGSKPVILFDQAHYNRHLVLDKENKPGSYHAFSKLAEALGCELRILMNQVNESRLKQANLLVIACPFSENNEPYTTGEIDTIKSWVEQGGSLLLITDHIPFSNSAVSLAKAFAIQFTIGTVVDHAQGDKTVFEPGRIIYSTEKYSEETALLINTSNIITYTGQGVKKMNEEYRMILRFSPTAYFEDREGNAYDAKGFSQLITIQFGKGKVAVTGEAAFLTAQIKGDELIGLNNRDYDNEKLCKNLLVWLLL